MRLAPVLQLSSTECGIASLAMVCAYYGLQISLDELRKHCGTSRDGVRATGLIQAAERLGLQAEAYRVELDEITALTIPVIAFWRFNHFVVIKKVRRNKVYLNDPATGACVVGLDEFDKCFTGIILVLTPAAHFRRIPAPAKWRPILTTWLAHHVPALLFIVMCVLLTLAIPLLNARLCAIFVDYTVLNQQYAWLPALTGLILLAICILLSALRMLQETQFRLSAKAGLMQSARMMQHLLRLPLMYFSLRQKPELTALIMRAQASAASVFKSLGNMLANLIAAGFALIMMSMIDRQLSWWLAGLLLLYAIPLKLSSGLAVEYEQKNLVAAGRYFGDVLSGIKCAETIKACGVENNVLVRWQGAMQEKINALDLTKNLSHMLQLFYQSYYSLSLLVTLGVGVVRVNEGVLTVGGLMSFYSVQLFFTSQLLALQQGMKEWQAAEALQTRTQDVVTAAADERFVHSSPLVLNNQAPALQCVNLSFHYNLTQAPVLSDINLTIPTGAVVGFTGKTGSGKSTLIKLLAHLYQPSGGRLYLYGEDCHQGSASILPENIAYVSQESNLFSGTIYDNLTLGLPAVSEQVVTDALRDACLTELILARGLHGRVEEGGCNFSGGELQRLEIARALIQSTKILILDEATSALDAATEATIMQHLRKRQITIVMIAHRLNSLKNCDCIYVLEQGRIIERGDHAGLLANQSCYFDLVHAGRREIWVQ